MEVRENFSYPAAIQQLINDYYNQCPGSPDATCVELAASSSATKPIHIIT